MTMDESTWERMMLRARAARELAYAPYSNFQVGACLMTGSGQFFAGCNVENLSFGLTQCAERVAIGAMVAEVGRQDVVAVVVVAEGSEPISPCGACRQVLAEFGDPTVRMVAGDGRWLEMSLAQLLPRAKSGILDRGETGSSGPA